jgi:hypothetical protein
LEGNYATFKTNRGNSTVSSRNFENKTRTVVYNSADSFLKGNQSHYLYSPIKPCFNKKDNYNPLNFKSSFTSYHSRLKIMFWGKQCSRIQLPCLIHTLISFYQTQPKKDEWVNEWINIRNFINKIPTHITHLSWCRNVLSQSLLLSLVFKSVYLLFPWP